MNSFSLWGALYTALILIGMQGVFPRLFSALPETRTIAFLVGTALAAGIWRNPVTIAGVFAVTLYLLMRLFMPRLRRHHHPLVRAMGNPNTAVRLVLESYGLSPMGARKQWRVLIRVFQNLGMRDLAKRVDEGGDAAVEEILEEVRSFDPSVAAILQLAYHAKIEEVRNIINIMETYFRNTFMPKMMMRVLFASFISLIVGIFVVLSIFLIDRLSKASF